MKSTLLWRPTAQRIDDSRLGEFQTALTKAYGLSFENYEDLHRWSVTDPERFWAAVWEFSGVCSSRLADSVTTDGDKFPGARWFEGARLNYAENLLSGCGSGVAIVSYLENGRRSELTWSELRDQVAMMAAALKRSGVVEGDRVAGDQHLAGALDLREGSPFAVGVGSQAGAALAVTVEEIREPWIQLGIQVVEHGRRVERVEGRGPEEKGGLAQVRLQRGAAAGDGVDGGCVGHGVGERGVAEPHR